MVLTRARFAAQESLAAREQASMSAIVEHVQQAPSSVSKPPSVGDQLATLAQHLLHRTQALADEHTALQLQQQGQSDAQNAALMAVHTLTETSVRNLTDQQRIIVEKLGEALTATQAGLHDQFLRMQMTQDERGRHIERFVNERLAQVLQDVQRKTRESQLAINAQTKEVHRRLEKVTSKVDGELEEIVSHIQQLVESKLVASQQHMRLGEETNQLVQQKVHAASKAVKAAIKESLDKDLYQACEVIRQELTQSIKNADEPQLESARALAVEVSSVADSRMQKALMNSQGELNLQIQRQADATAALQKQVRKQGVRIKNKTVSTKILSSKLT